MEQKVFRSNNDPNARWIYVKESKENSNVITIVQSGVRIGILKVDMSDFIKFLQSLEY